jgi:hypothetical protein
MSDNFISRLKGRFHRLFWHGYWTDPAVFFSLVPAIAANLGMWALIWFSVTPTDQPIILHYNVYFGVDAIGDWRGVFVLPGIAAALLVVNAVISRFFYYKERLASYLFAAMALVAQLLAAVGLGSVILINF